MNTNLINNNAKINKSKFVKRICIFLFLLLILMISFFRVPVIGVVIDASIFELIFGYSKYIIYIFLFIILILWIANKNIHYWLAKRKLLFYLSILFCVCLLFATINYYINKLNTYSFRDFYLDKKYSYFTNWYEYNFKYLIDMNKYVRFNIYSWGGLIGTFIVSIVNNHGLIIILILVLLFSICVGLFIYDLKISRKIKNKLVNSLGGFHTQQLNIKTQKVVSNIDIELVNKNIIDLLNKESIAYSNLITNEFEDVIELSFKSNINNIEKLININEQIKENLKLNSYLILIDKINFKFVINK